MESETAHLYEERAGHQCPPSRSALIQWTISAVVTGFAAMSLRIRSIWTAASMLCLLSAHSRNAWLIVRLRCPGGML